MRALRGVLFVAALAGTVSLTSSGEKTEDATLARGIALMRAGNHAGAVEVLERVAKREPQDARVWRALGAAQLSQKHADAAIEAFKRALEIDPAAAAPMYNLGLAYALKPDKDQAFAWLAKAKVSRKVDMTQIEFAPELKSLKDDPRFPALLPARKDFDDPFTERVKIVREWDGEAANDQFGWIARNIGDVDGDGVPDVMTSAPSHAGDAGRVYVYSTKTGKQLWSSDGEAGDQLGTGVESAGDTNGDGIPDVIASAPGGGYAKVYSGRDGRILLTLKAENVADEFGRHADGCGDVNHDGFADVIVGAPGNNSGGPRAGRAYVFSGQDGKLLLTLTGERAGDEFGSAVAGSSTKKSFFLAVGAPKGGPNKTGRVSVYDSLSQKPKFTADSDETGAALGGMFLSIPGDIDGDGTPDIYASDWSNGAKGPSTGRVYIYSGRDGHKLLALTGEAAGDGFGTSPSVAGDVDGDGYADLIVGAWQHASGAVGAGAAYLYSGKDGRLLKKYTCRIPGDTFGFDAVTMGDVDGDGDADFLITSAWSGVHGFHSGRVFILSSGVAKITK